VPYRGPPQPTHHVQTMVPTFTRRLFFTTHPGPHSDDLLNMIPEPTLAITNVTLPPFRSIPPDIIAAITTPEPNVYLEPDWRALLAHFESPNASYGLANLQDLYLWLTRVGIPNAIIDNRRFLLHFYLRNRNAPPNTTLCYDAYAAIDTYTPLTNEPRASPANRVPSHSIFASFPTPDGRRFSQWLRNDIFVPAPGHSPAQLRHGVSVLDGYLDEDETALRQVERAALVERTVKVLRIYWWLWGTLRALQLRQDAGWVGMEEFMA